ncbi:MAG: phosphoribosylamine--glycine ligase [Chlamydiota bacterium]
MKILVIGGGGREHALAHTFKRQGHHVYCLPGNAGTQQICEPLPKEWKAIDHNDFEQLIAFAKDTEIDLTVCGPEAPLELGLADLFSSAGMHFFGPSKVASKIECRKAWSKDFMKKYHIPTARSVTFRNSKEAKEISSGLFYDWGGLVIKPSGLTAGKGVTICDKLIDTEKAISLIMDNKKFGDAGQEIVIEEKLIGKEVSIMAFCDGQTIVPMMTAQDHKRLYDGGQGPNTGGVGAYTPTPFLSEKIMNVIEHTIINKTLEGLKQEGIDYKGFLYFGIMLTVDGPKVLEYNCRFGDPEAQVILPLIESDLADILLHCCEGRLSEADVRWSQQAACTVVMISRGYPKKFKTGYTISGLQEVEKNGEVIIFHGGTKIGLDGNITTAGGRVIAVTSLAASLSEAIDQSYAAVKKIHFEGAYYRSDIGSQSSIENETAQLTATV